MDANPLNKSMQEGFTIAESAFFRFAVIAYKKVKIYGNQKNSAKKWSNDSQIHSSLMQ
jgi:hypothetical protein